MRHHSTVLLTSDLSAARDFYERILGMKVARDLGGEVFFAGGFGVRQVERARAATPRGVTAEGRDTMPAVFEVLLESDDVEEDFAAVTASGSRIVHPIREGDDGRQMFRCLDPDGHVVTVAEPFELAIRRLFARGVVPEDISRMTLAPMEVVLQVIGYPRFC